MGEVSHPIITVIRIYEQNRINNFSIVRDRSTRRRGSGVA